MSYRDFIKLLQNIITMVDPTDKKSIKKGKALLNDTVDFCIKSGKVDRMTLRIMNESVSIFSYLIENRDIFAGVLREYQENEQKRRRLEMTLNPHC